MKLNEYQNLAERTHDKCGCVEVDLEHVAFGLSTETGEFTNPLKRHLFYGTELDKANMIEELGDLMWYIAIGANALAVTLEEVAKRNISKLQHRYPDKFTKEDAVERKDKLRMKWVKGDDDELPF